MTIDKHRKRAIRELAAAEGISYAAAHRILLSRQSTDDNPAPTGEPWSAEDVDDAESEWDDDGWAEIQQHFYAVLTQHDVYCVNEAAHDAIDLGIDDDEGAIQVAAQLLEGHRSPCRCRISVADSVPAAAVTNYRVPIHFQQPPAAEDRFDSTTDFAQQLSDLLGVFVAFDARWNPRYLFGTAIAAVGDRTFIAEVTIGAGLATLVPPGLVLPAIPEEAAERVVAHALTGLGYDQEAATIAADAITVAEARSHDEAAH